MKQIRSTPLYLFALSVIVAIGVGWVLNLLNVFQWAGGPLTGEVILQIIGIFVGPLGGILGWIL